MNKLIIDVAGEKIFLMIITDNDIYNINKENTKFNYEKLTLIINVFLNSHKLSLKDINKFFEFKSHKIAQRLRDISGESTVLKIKGRAVRVWAIPSFDSADVELKPKFNQEGTPF